MTAFDDLDQARSDGDDLAWPARARRGGEYLFSVPDVVPAVWGDGDDVLWAKGEGLMLTGPQGVGKTTIAAQLVLARLGLLDGVLGWPLDVGERVLYMAMDRPNQFARAMRRCVDPAWRDTLDDRLVIWPGPPPTDLAAKPEQLLTLVRRVSADTVVLDSIKDAAVGISDDAVGAGLNTAMQTVIADDRELLALHHQRKGTGGPPKTLEDVYGSTWLTAGMGSIVLLWGAPGDPIVELRHLKQPADEVGPIKVEHDHTTGRSTVYRGTVDPLRVLAQRPNGMTCRDLAVLLTEKTEPSDNDRRKAQRKLDRLVELGLAKRDDPVRGGDGGAQAARYYPTGGELEEAS